MQKWEYLVVKEMKVDALMRVESVFKMTNKGLELVKQFYDKAYFKNAGHSLPGDAVQSVPNAVAQYIAQLGDEGWEMVGGGNVSESSHYLYFKRPKP